ncbi:hypothetical protein JI435_407850 [Parastagonospora nodorum SN15]|uniref:Uncharacterized protein n=1 Tax=Phaeosphaeria nodorum (strain SN15 / ATCC MYA-4574 / FGSC 10173) TaxID=321614 RepID=A0A7U2I1A9_PHANO|nr:hypothetical protein JI435_407850 [Parastagonospora nodorum SN15]
MCCHRARCEAAIHGWVALASRAGVVGPGRRSRIGRRRGTSWK